MDSTVDAIEAAYGALLDAVAALLAESVRSVQALQELRQRLDAFHASCDRADDLVCAATNRLALTADANLDALLRSVQAMDAKPS
uniref:Uncharacterized protein n=1 Tax=Oryza brachyantha TaxID=4533 RepID=J3LIP4_ORYBR